MAAVEVKVREKQKEYDDYVQRADEKYKLDAKELKEALVTDKEIMAEKIVSDITKKFL